MLDTFRKYCSVLLLLTLISGCSSTSFSDLFTTYNQQMHNVRQAQINGNYLEAISHIPTRNKENNSYYLSLLEKARLEFLAGNNQQSQKHFEQVFKHIQASQLAAKIELSRGVENIAAVMSNDNAIRYDIPLYEQGMLHSYQALNYIAQEDLSGALVEIRRANLVQEQALLANADSIYSYHKRMAAQGLSDDELNRHYPSMKNTIGNIKNGFQNAYTFYLSALLFEASGQKNDAYIDYKKALEIFPTNPFLQQNVWRLANYLSMHDDVELLKTMLPEDITKSINRANQGRIVFVIENGIVASKQEVAVNLPISTRRNTMRFYSVALPSYQNQIVNYSPLRLEYKGKYIQSAEIVRLQSLAAKQLKDELPVIVSRQIVRLIAKEKVRQQLERKNGELGNVFASLYNLASEKADTRSWSTLPDSVQIMEVDFPKGEHQFLLNINGINQQIDATVNTNRITLIKVNAIGDYSQHAIYNL